MFQGNSVLLGQKLAASFLAFAGGKDVLSADEVVALACSGMILICEGADTPVIMGISKPASLNIHVRR